MNIQEFKKAIQIVDTLEFVLPNNTLIPAHFHITEMGLLTKNFIDCGNTIREEKLITFQIWFAGDFEHRLNTEKVLKIIDASKSLIGEQNLDIEVEYQTETTIGKFGLDFKDNKFHLTPKETTCLANDHCGIPLEKMKMNIGESKIKENCCSDSKCC
jgi:Family of unknown function (DUF6428)